MYRKMPCNVLAILSILVLLSVGVSVAGSISGTITYDGRIPKLRPLDMQADPICISKHDKPVPNDMLLLGDGNTLANILVFVSEGLPEKEWPTPTEPAVLNQQACIYIPRVQGVMVNQPFKILNSDAILHNVHSLSEINKPFNMAMPADRTEAVEVFSKEECVFRIKCDIHPWMTAFVAVFPHPFHVVTGLDGTFEINDLPAGTYEIKAWHEKLGTMTMRVALAESDDKQADFKFTPPKKR
jgi:hypothetical protein